MTRSTPDPAIVAATHVVSKFTDAVLSMWDERIAFTGETPYLVGDLMALLPEPIVAEEEALPEGVTLVVVGMDDFSEELISDAASLAEPPRFVPQEGFLDELLFGYDWWSDAVDQLNRFLDWHPGLQYVHSLAGEQFEWPSTDAPESAGNGTSSPDYQEQTELRRLGYQITGLTRAQRWHILTRSAIPKLGLQPVAETIAFNTRLRKRQRSGRTRYAYAIGEWEHDLGRLHSEFYLPAGHAFRWPTTEE